MNAAAGADHKLSDRRQTMTVKRWTLVVEMTRPDGTTEQHEVGSIQRDTASLGLEGLGLQLAEANDLLHRLQYLANNGDAVPSNRSDTDRSGPDRRESGAPRQVLPDRENRDGRRDLRQRKGRRRNLSRSGQ